MLVPAGAVTCVTAHSCGQGARASMASELSSLIEKELERVDSSARTEEHQRRLKSLRVKARGLRSNKQHHCAHACG